MNDGAKNEWMLLPFTPRLPVCENSRIPVAKTSLRSTLGKRKSDSVDDTLKNSEDSNVPDCEIKQIVSQIFKRKNTALYHRFENPSFKSGSYHVRRIK